MSHNYGANQYKKASVTTASRGQVLIMLYEAAIRNVKKASICIENNDVAGKGQAIVKVHDIVNELNCSLDHSIGGEIASDLERLYNFIAEQLVKANVENDREVLASVEGILSNLLDGWRQAVREVESGKAVSKAE